jgi:hypothetical protein
MTKSTGLGEKTTGFLKNCYGVIDAIGGTLFALQPVVCIKEMKEGSQVPKLN